MTVRTGEQAPDDSLLAETGPRPVRHRAPARPLSAEAAGALVHERLGRGRGLLRECLPPDDLGQPAAAAPAAARAGGGGRTARRVARRHRARRRLASGLVPGDAAPAPDAQRRHGRRARGRGARRGRPAARRRRAGAAARGGGRGRAGHAEPRRDPPRTGARWRSSIPSSATRCTATCRPPTARCTTSARRQLLASRARLRAGRRAPAAGPAPRQPGTVAMLRAAARTAMARGASDAAVVLLRRALDEPVPADDRAEVLIELGLVETLVDGPASAAHLTEADELVEDTPSAPGSPCWSSVPTSSRPRPAWRPPSRARGRGVPAGLDDERQGLVALRRIRVSCTGSRSGLPFRAGPGGQPATVTGPGCSRPRSATSAARRRGPCRGGRAAPVRARARPAAGRRQRAAVDRRRQRAAARRRGPGRLLGPGPGPGARHRGLFAVLSVNLWRGFTQWRHGQLEDALQSLADATEQQRMWGVSDVRPRTPPRSPSVSRSTRATWAAATAALDAARELPWVGEGGRLLAESAARLRLEQGLPAEALDGAHRSRSSTRQSPTRPGRPGAGLKARALAALGPADEAVALAEEEVALLRRWGRPLARTGPPGARRAARPSGRLISGRRWTC